jgi:hypothetical protein
MAQELGFDADWKARQLVAFEQVARHFSLEADAVAGGI